MSPSPIHSNTYTLLALFQQAAIKLSFHNLYLHYQDVFSALDTGFHIYLYSIIQSARSKLLFKPKTFGILLLSPSASDLSIRFSAFVIHKPTLISVNSQIKMLTNWIKCIALRAMWNASKHRPSFTFHIVIRRVIMLPNCTIITFRLLHVLYNDFLKGFVKLLKASW